MRYAMSVFGLLLFLPSLSFSSEPPCDFCKVPFTVKLDKNHVFSNIVFQFKKSGGPLAVVCRKTKGTLKVTLGYNTKKHSSSGQSWGVTKNLTWMPRIIHKYAVVTDPVYSASVVLVNQQPGDGEFAVVKCGYFP